MMRNQYFKQARGPLLTVGIVSFFVAFASFKAVQAGESPTSHPIKILWTATQPNQDLKSWSVTDLEHLKEVSSREKDAAGEARSFRGPLMSSVIEKAIESLPGDQQAQVDLIILKNEAGDQVQIPRWLVTKYPVLLAPQKGAVKLVLPLSSKPKIWEEGLPLNRFQLHDVASMEFANYRQIYGSLYLNRTMDPVAKRGEKIFVQNCMNCHAVNGKAALMDQAARKLASTGHPTMKDAPQLKSREMRALSSYLDAFRLENPSTTSASFTGK